MISPPPPTEPGEIIVLTLETGNGQISATWVAPEDNGGSEVTGYHLRHSADGGTNWARYINVAAPTTNHTITELTNGAEYIIQVRAVNAQGNGAWSGSAAATPVAVPMAPTAFMLEAENMQITATWAAPDDDGGSEITGYKLQYREVTDPEGSWLDVTTDSPITTTSHTITELTNGTEYEVQVRAVNAQGNGNPSEILTAIPVTIPSAPDAPTLTHGNTKLTATWAAPDDDGGSEIIRYELQYREVTDPEGIWLNVTTDSEITTTSHTITELTNGTEYEVQVRAVNAQGNSEWSGSATETPDITPNAPAVPTLTVGNTQLTATWSAPTDTGGSAITRYELQYRKGSSGAWTLISSGIGTRTNHTITGLTNGDSYEVQVRAVNAQGTSPWSSSASATPATVPVAPADPTLTEGNAQLSAAWSAPNNGGSAITRYELQYRKGSSGAWTLISSGIGTRTNHTITGLTNGDSYEVRVRAVNTRGDGAWSGSSIATPVAVPNTPTALTLTVGNTQLGVAWSAPTDTGGSPITRYKLQYRKGSSGAWTPITSDIGSTRTNHTIAGLTNGDSYEVQVRAENAQGTSPWSSSASATPATVPVAPADPTLTVGNTQLSAAWSAPNNGGSAITRYELQYRKGSSGAWTLISSGIGTSHTITGLTNGDSYEVRVRAVNAQGDGAWSGSSTATPDIAPNAPTAPTLTAGNTHITATWSAPTDNGGSAITRYELQYRTGGGAWTFITSGIGTNTSHTITGLTNGDSYEVRVRAVNAQGNSPWSSSAAATPATVPDAPTALAFQDGDEFINLTATARGSNGGSVITGFELQYRDTDNDEWILVTDISAQTSSSGNIYGYYRITGLTNGRSYSVRARVVNAVGKSGWSHSITANPLGPPGAPENVMLAVGDGQLAVSWSAPTDTGGIDITKYYLRYKKNGALSWTYDSDDIGASTSHTITGLTNGDTYSVQVQAVNSNSPVPGPWSEIASASPATVPDAPTDLTLTEGNTRFSVAWSAPTDNGGSAITRYELQYRTGGGAWTLITSGIGTNTSHIIMGLTNGNTYEVQVRAVNAQGDGAWSASTTAMLTVPVFAKQVPAGTAVSAILSADIDTLIANQNPTVSLTTVEQGTLAVSGSDITVTPATTPNGITIPTVNASGIITVTASTTAGTYVVYGETETNDILFAEYFSVIVSPADGDGSAGVANTDGGNDELKTAVNTGISTWGQTANLNYIITTAVTDMSEVFKDASAFNGDISDWDTSAVTTIYGIFEDARSFNGDISDWNVSTVTSMDSMFDNARSFNGDISAWDVSSVTSMNSMFNQARKFNGDISDWNVSSVTSMSSMFDNARLFNGDISAWNVSSVTSMSSMFNQARKFNGDISAWDVSSVKWIDYMFSYASVFNADISNWDISSVFWMPSMFSYASAFNADISGWDVSSVTSMSSMFRNASVFNADISDWDVSSVEQMSSMFNSATAFSRNIEEWKDHWTLSGGKYTGTTTQMFVDSGLDANPVLYDDSGNQPNYPSWY